MSPNKEAAFAALSGFTNNSLDGLRIALQKAGYTLDKYILRPLILEWVCWSVPAYAEGSKLRNGKLVVNGKHKDAGSIRMKIRDLMLNLQGTSRRKAARASTPVAPAVAPAQVALLVKVLVGFETQKEARAAFTLAMAKRFPRKARKPKHKYVHSHHTNDLTPGPPA
jgi:hypothetical protein